MPLVVPGLMSKDGSSNEDWSSKLMGKKLGDGHNETTFAKSDLPKESRVLEHGSMATQDHKEGRLNIHLGEDGTVRDVTKG